MLIIAVFNHSKTKFSSNEMADQNHAVLFCRCWISCFSNQRVNRLNGAEIAEVSSVQQKLRFSAARETLWFGCK